ncbi:MAG: vWA domain-containing protein [Planctomycetota bacterium]|jgi:hypothetical protein
MRGAGAFLLCLLAVHSPASGEESVTAAGVTERGRSLGNVLDVVLGTGGAEEKGPRTFVFLLDATASLKSAAFDTAFGEALQRNAAKLDRTRIWVARVGAKDAPALAFAAKRGRMADVAKATLAAPTKAFQNVYADVRRAASFLARKPGTRRMVLVTLENGDMEDDVEATLGALRRAKVRLFVVGREAYLCDSYWQSGARRSPRGLQGTGGDAAFIELPWGWLFQMAVANETVPSGFAMYGLSRLATGTEGRVFLYAPAKSEHRCQASGPGCHFCRGDHIPPGATYQPHRLQALAPLVVPRRQAYAAALRDPCFRAVRRAWRRASKEGLVRSRPSLRPSGEPERRPLGSWATLTGSLAFARNAARAEKLARTCREVVTSLEADLARASGGRPRYRAIAELTRVMLHVTRVNLLALAAWCRETGPAMAGKERRDLKPPELPWYAADLQFVGIAYSNLSLCHGIRPFRDVRLPGGEAFRRELDALAGVVEPFLARYAHTPYAAAVRRAGLARFSLSVRGTTVPRKRDPSSSETDRTTTDERPDRAGPGETGGGSPTTGGGG